MSFAYPWVLYFLLLIPVLLYWYWKKNKTISPNLTYSSLGIFNNLKPTLKEKFKHVPAVLRALAVALFIVALARPQTFSTGENVYTEGIDIAMLLDISGSMLAEDFKPNRLDAAKNVTDEFIAGRTSDKIGLVVFARESFTQCPLTIDYRVLRSLLKDIYSGMIEDGTAIGTAIANGVNRLKDSNAESKVIILLTDGVNNSGEIDPISAAQIAQTFGIRIYTIGVGTQGEAPYPFQTPFGKRYQMVPVEIDENVLRQVADITSGKYFRATDNRKLEQIYKEIDKLVKTRVEVTSYRNQTEKFQGWILAGLFLITLEVVLSRTYLKRLP
ncbi:MAG: aerotolerance regulator BatA [Ignavibacteria bacterium RBG_13_36_8]|nr:MAG: aerotolerance regulator BatA [Ignavibacteria bacterium RBG_13_36_8]